MTQSRVRSDCTNSEEALVAVRRSRSVLPPSMACPHNRNSGLRSAALSSSSNLPRLERVDGGNWFLKAIHGRLAVRRGYWRKAFLREPEPK